MNTRAKSDKSAKTIPAKRARRPAKVAAAAAAPTPTPAKPAVVFSPWTDPTQKPLVEFVDVHKRFGDFVAVDGVNLKIFTREFFALLGPSGCGKTTLLRMLAGFETPTSGTILVDGKDISEVPPNQRPINMMFQSYALFPHLTVADNIGFGLKRAGMDKESARKRTDEMLALVQMAQFANRKPHQLSGGQRQRVALARALARKPKILLLDEPLGALDAKLREQTQFELMNIQETTGTTFIIVTHDQEEAMTVASRIGLMNKGKLAQVSTPPEIYENPNSRFVADFIGDVNILAGKAGKSVRIDGEEFQEFLHQGARFVARAFEPVSVGQDCFLAVRPEKIAIAKSRPDDVHNLLSGRVHDIAYGGNLSTFHVRLEDKTIVKAQEANRRRIANRAITWEEQVWLSWTPGSGLILAR
jgi:putrescine transport system ATP-binding protein